MQILLSLAIFLLVFAFSFIVLRIVEFILVKFFSIDPEETMLSEDEYFKNMNNNNSNI